MATQQVTGAWAARRQEFKEGTVSQLLGYLQMTGQPVLDPRNGLIKPRIQVDGALSPTSGPASKLAFTTQPKTVPSGKSMSSAENEAVEDTYGHRVYTDNSNM